MQACSCGVAHDDNSSTCPALQSPLIMREVLSNSSAEPVLANGDGNKLIDQLTDGEALDSVCDEVIAEEDESPSIETRSTLIEFPGAVKPVPEWRKQLNQRVREVQERKAREAAEEAAAAQEAGTVSCVLPSAQLELVPNLEQPSLNPIVSKVLERLERARRPETAGNTYTAAATAPALAPLTQDLSEPEAVPEAVAPKPPETKTKLTVVAPAPPPVEAVNRKPVRVITDRIDDVALSYLESYLSVPALESDFRNDHPGHPRRIIAGLIDLLLVGVMVTPVAAVIQYTGGHWTDPRVFGVMSGITVMTLFAYLTISIALTGRTLAMRMLSLRTIDIHTGLIPTGGQSIKRAIAYIFCLVPLGLGLLFALIDPDGRAIHDRFSKTMVIRN
jgi:uncharacterized RDD family membrane protein YckC